MSILSRDSDGCDEKLEWHPNAGLPEGQAAVFLRWAGGGLVPIADVATQAPLRRRPRRHGGRDNHAPLRHLLRNDGEEPLSGMVEAVTLFRGHERLAGFYIGQQSPERPSPIASRRWGHLAIRVKGDITQKTQIIFVLDCSGSMKEEMEVEGQQKLTPPPDRAQPTARSARFARRRLLSGRLGAVWAPRRRGRKSVRADMKWCGGRGRPAAKVAPGPGRGAGCTGAADKIHRRGRGSPRRAASDCRQAERGVCVPTVKRLCTML